MQFAAVVPLLLLVCIYGGTARSAEAIPTQYDARQDYRNCSLPVANQGQCGSGWAFAVAESISHRMCINQTGKASVDLSPQQLVACDTGAQGCQGGDFDSAFQFAQKYGLPTWQCVPYTSDQGTTGNCANACVNGDPWTTASIKSYARVNGVANIQAEIVNNGPVAASMTVYQDFLSYEEGVYSHVTGTSTETHGVLLVGYGVFAQTNQSYWVGKNSWSSDWGYYGYFWILSGVNECGIEDSVYAAQV